MNEGQALWIALTASVVAIICGVVFSLQIIKESDVNVVSFASLPLIVLVAFCLFF